MSVAVVRDDTCAWLAVHHAWLSDAVPASVRGVHSPQPQAEPARQPGFNPERRLAWQAVAVASVGGRSQRRQPGAGGRSLRQGVCRGPCPCDLTRLGCGCRHNWRPVKRANLRAHPASTVSCWLCLAASADGGCPTFTVTCKHHCDCMHLIPSSCRDSDHHSRAGR
eukprot:COSAG01_NODE_649_length_14487_cov_12.974624_10_plen_166_part_00